LDNATIADGAHRAVQSSGAVLDTGSSIFATLGYLCLILGGLFLVYWLLRRFGPFGMGTPGSNAHSPRLLGRLYLGNRQSVAVVRYKTKTMVLGVTEHQINLLGQEEGDEPEDNEPSSSAFAGLLKGKVEDASES
jgi:flagellar protein FliO/FliZ